MDDVKVFLCLCELQTNTQNSEEFFVAVWNNLKMFAN